MGETIKSARNGLKILSAARARSSRSNNLPQTETNLPVPYDIYSENLPRRPGMKGIRKKNGSHSTDIDLTVSSHAADANWGETDAERGSVGYLPIS